MTLTFTPAQVPASSATVDLTLQGVRQPPNKVGTVEWLHPVSGEFHRIDGPAVEGEAGHFWYVNGVQHRDDGPAYYAVGDPDFKLEYWYCHGKLHRLDGPAWIHSTGHVWMVDSTMLDDSDAPVLDELHAAGETKLLELVLSAWRPDGPSTADLLAAVRTATS